MVLDVSAFRVDKAIFRDQEVILLSETAVSLRRS